MKEKQYVIQGVKLRMGEMTLGQDKKLLELMNGREINFEEMKGLQGTISYLLKNDILNDFLKVILRGCKIFCVNGDQSLNYMFKNGDTDGHEETA